MEVETRAQHFSAEGKQLEGVRQRMRTDLIVETHDSKEFHNELSQKSGFISATQQTNADQIKKLESQQEKARKSQAKDQEKLNKQEAKTMKIARENAGRLEKDRRAEEEMKAKILVEQQEAQRVAGEMLWKLREERQVIETKLYELIAEEDQVRHKAAELNANKAHDIDVMRKREQNLDIGVTEAQSNMAEYHRDLAQGRKNLEEMNKEMEALNNELKGTEDAIRHNKTLRQEMEAKLRHLATCEAESRERFQHLLAEKSDKDKEIEELAAYLDNQEIDLRGINIFLTRRSEEKQKVGEEATELFNCEEESITKAVVLANEVAKQRRLAQQRLQQLVDAESEMEKKLFNISSQNPTEALINENKEGIIDVYQHTRTKIGSPELAQTNIASHVEQQIPEKPESMGIMEKIKNIF